MHVYDAWVHLILYSFYGSKGEKPRVEDFSSRIRRFVYDSKANVGIVILLFYIDQTCRSRNREYNILL